MAEQQKGKTKAAILQELESIKGLLLEEDDIPLLQEVIDNAEDHIGDQDSLGNRDLEELQQTYRDLLLARETLEDQPKKSSGKKPEVQTSLFDVGTSLPDPDEPESRPTAAQRRTSVTKASGENPFLPAHIRERLHGNRPPPMFEPLSPYQPAEVSVPESQAHQESHEGQKNRGSTERDITSEKLAYAQEKTGRTQLIDSLIADLMPDLEAELRLRLMAMTEEELQKLRD